MVRTFVSFLCPLYSLMLYTPISLCSQPSPLGHPEQGKGFIQATALTAWVLCYFQIQKLRSRERIRLTAGQGTIGQHPCPNIPPRQVVCWCLPYAEPHAEDSHASLSILKHTDRGACTEKEASRFGHVTKCFFQPPHHPSS